MSYKDAYEKETDSILFETKLVEIENDKQT